MLNIIYFNNYQIQTDEEFKYLKKGSVVELCCWECKNKNKFIKKNKYIRKKYFCRSCSKTGIKNPFYGKHHSEEAKKKIGGNVKDYSKEKNPFYGKKHSAETKIKISQSSSQKKGEKNGFYKKKHSDKAKQIIKEKNKQYRLNNEKELVNKQLLNLNLDIDKLKLMLNDYIKEQSKISFQKKYKIDFRTAQNYWFKFSLTTKEELSLIKKFKKLNSNPSQPEKDLKILLEEKYGADNVIHGYELKNYVYDFCIFKKILIEYDGYYWHKILINKNDIIKNKIAAECNYILYRIEEENNRKTDLNKHIPIIDEIVKKNEINQNK